MKYFRYSIADDEIKALIGEIDVIPPDYIELESGLGGESVYYKIKDGKITDAIGEGFEETTARMRVEDFISALNVNLF
jgi:hypothetical protein